MATRSWSTSSTTSDDNGICYDEDGVTIRHWRRSHTKDGASAYRLDWNGLSFVWTGDGRPDELSVELSQGVDVFVTEVQPDTGNLQALKFGMPPVMLNNTIDQAHSVHYAVGYMFEQIQPRLAMVTHLSFDEELIPEIVAGIRHHYNGLFQFGAPDVVVVNVDKDSVWTRKAVIPDAGNMARPTPREAAQLYDLSPDEPVGDLPDAAAPGVRRPRPGGLGPADRPEEVLPDGPLPRAGAELPRGLHDRRPRGRPAQAAPHAGEALGHGGHAPARRRRHRAGAAGGAGQLVPDEASGSPAIPLTVLTGFLGAGKTTLLNRILTGDHGLRIAVLVNDFGSINIDADLVVGLESDGDLISLANGCVCCNVRDDLVTAVTQVMARPDQPEYIILEASGVAEPSSIALTFMDEDLRDRIRLDSIMCVIDAEQVFAVPEMMELKLRQVAFADMLILNKVDLVTRDEIDQIKAWLDDRFHRYRLVEASNGNVPLEILLSVGRFDPTQIEEPHQHDHSDARTRRCSGPGATRPTSPCRSRRCASRPVSSRPACTAARAWCTPRRSRADESSSRSSASAWTSRWSTSGTVEPHAPRSSSSVPRRAWMRRRSAASSTTAWCSPTSLRRKRQW